jgi:ABC-type oligopeptide transport system substrate-binding subunit
MLLKAIFFITILCGGGIQASAFFDPKDVPVTHAIAMHGKVAHSPQDSFSLVNPNAPKGGVLHLGHVGASFVTLNPFSPGQECAPHVFMTYDALMARSPNEPFSLYGLLAKGIQVPPDRSWLIIHLNPLAKFHSGQPVTAEDVIFSYQTLCQYGPPGRRVLAHQVAKVAAIDPRTVRFDFVRQDDGRYNQELPLLVLIMRIFSKDSLNNSSFDKTGYTPLQTSGPYKVKSVDHGKSVTYVRDPNYWGKDLVVNKGRFNTDEITIDVFFNETAAFESFIKGVIDCWEEKDFQRWKRGYHVPAVTQGNIVRSEVVHRHPVGMFAFALNQNHPALKDIRVRKAISLAFNPQELRLQMDEDCALTHSFFQLSEFEAPLVPSAQEQAILDQLPYPGAFEMAPPFVKMEKTMRRKKALSLLKEAGWELVQGQLMRQGVPLQMVILTKDRAETKIAEVFARTLKEVGIHPLIKQAKATHYTKMVNDRSYDVLLFTWMHSLSPGAEQGLYWHSESAKKIGTRNYSAIENPNVDFLCAHILKSKTRQDLVASLQALDRVLRSGYYVVPLFHRTKDYRAFWKYVKTPPYPSHSPDCPALDSFWIDVQEQNRIQNKK